VSKFKSGFYIVWASGDTETFYGPFSSKEEAQKVSYFGQSFEVNDNNWITKFPFHVYYYDANDLIAIEDDPETYADNTYVKFEPPQIPIHNSWLELCNNDLKKIDDIWEQNLAIMNKGKRATVLSGAIKTAQIRQNYDYGESMYMNLDKYKSVSDFRKKRRGKRKRDIKNILDSRPDRYKVKK
jgi:hypothetical protein